MRAASEIGVAAGSGGRYELGQSIATGGMGHIQRAFDRLGQREVAYKRLRATDEQGRKLGAVLFQREYETLKRLAHPNIVEVYEFGYDQLGPYYTMELLSGSDVTHLAPLPLGEACRLLRDVCSALALVHSRRLVHRDLSPNNVRLTVHGRAKLIDFGALTHFGVQSELIGTPPFIAPECLRLSTLDQRADLYALGALAYFCLTGKLHMAALTMDALRAADGSVIVPPSQLSAGVPKELDALILSLLDRDPTARPASAAEVIERLSSLAQLPAEDDELSAATSYFQHTPLAGRDAINAELDEALHAALSGSGQIVLLRGERGVGCSALLDQFAINAQLAGATVLQSNGGQANSGPFGAAYELVQSGLLLFPDAANSVSHGTLQPAQLLLPVRAQDSLRSAIEASEQQTLVATALTEALLRLSLRTPLVLLVDDAQALDLESLSLFAALCEPLRRHPIMLVLTLGPQGAERDSAARARLETNGRCLELLPLSAEELAAVARGIFGAVPHMAQLERFLYARTSGNPGHTLDLLHDLLGRGIIRYAGGTFSLPHEIVMAESDSVYAHAQLARLTAIAPLARRIASLLALHPGVLHAEQVSSTLDVSAPDALRGLEDLCRSAVAARRADAFFCNGEVLRAELLHKLDAEQCRSMHVALAGTLAARDRESLEGRLAVANHLLQAGGDEAVEGAYLVAQTANQHRFQVAMRRDAFPIFEKALEVLQQRGLADEECVGLLVPLSLAGFYGSLDMQRRYLDRTLLALSSLSGLMVARRLTRFLGGTLALYLGLAVAFFSHLFTRRKLNRRSFSDSLQALMSVTPPATAAAASTFDPVESYRIAAWLDPLAVTPRSSGLYCVREFCLATAELIAGKVESSCRRYAHVRATFERPVLGVDELVRDQAVLGSLHGEAQGMVTDCDPQALTLADQLQRRGLFYAPHAECVRMTYYAFRGEHRQAALHLERSESLAFQGGTAWSAMSVLSARSVQAYVLTGNVVALMRVVVDLERLATLAPTMAALAELARAHLALMRGKTDDAIAIYEHVLETPAARSLFTYPMERALHVRALGQCGEYAAARALCLPLLALPHTGGDEPDVVWRLPRQELALIEAHLGDFARAFDLLDGCLARAGKHDNPLALGSVHRDRARVHALAGDRIAFAEHAAIMEACFRATNNPWLIQQGRWLRANVAQLGLIDPATLELPLLADGLDGSIDLETQTALQLETALEIQPRTNAAPDQENRHLEPAS